MIIFVDSNVLVSAVLNPNGTPAKAFTKAVTLPNKAVICQQNIEEVIRTFLVKFPAKIDDIRKFFVNASGVVDIIQTPQEIIPTENKIRDITDRPIFRAAIEADADIILTGDKDFLEAGLSKPLPMSPAQFLIYNAYDTINTNSYFVHDVQEPYMVNNKYANTTFYGILKEYFTEEEAKELSVKVAELVAQNSKQKI